MEIRPNAHNLFAKAGRLNISASDSFEPLRVNKAGLVSMLKLFGNKASPGLVLRYDRSFVCPGRNNLWNHVDTSGFPDLFAVQRLEDGYLFIASFDNPRHRTVQFLKLVQPLVQQAFRFLW